MNEKEIKEAKNIVVFDKQLVQHYEDLGMVIPFKKLVEMVMYREVQNLIDRYIAPPVEEVKQ